MLLISDEIYRAFCYDRPFASPASWNEDVLVIDGFSKTHGMTGWRLGFAHGPRRLIQEMIKLQQFSFVCAPSLVQYAGVAALDEDLDATRRRLPPQARHGRRRLERRLRPRLARRGLLRLPQRPWGTATEFVAEAIRHNLLIIPGNVFSRRDTHFRISYAVDDTVLQARTRRPPGAGPFLGPDPSDLSGRPGVPSRDGTNRRCRPLHCLLSLRFL